MAIPIKIGRWLGWALLAGVMAMTLGGCKQREPNNPFLAPYGDSLTQPFG
jgi:hypothetical protein